MRSRDQQIFLLTLVLCIVGCGPSEPLQVSAIQLGRSLNPDNSIASHTTAFKPGDTMFVSALSLEKGYGTLNVRWMYMGHVVGEATKDVTYRGPAATEFHIQNATGFPPGDYSVEVFLNGDSVGKRDYRVDK